MAGHSKWANIQHRKGAQDAKRAKRFAKLVREVIVAARAGQPDPDHNARLRTAIVAAKAQSVPKENIERVLKKAQGGEDDVNFDELRYEGFGPGGIALMVDAMTDNRNRTAAEVRSIFNKHGGALGESGSVNYMFERFGAIRYESKVASADDMFEAALEVGASDCESDDDGHEVFCAPDDFGDVSEALAEKFGAPDDAGLIWKAQTTVPIDEKAAESLFKLMEALDDCDDVQNVAANFDVSDDVMQKLSA
ncbi:MAG: YebC/PmpR family DNA-binding transcriptional regulator [Rhodospirillaceae bacterium]|nr:YebC/PmpR family DNA-binding transcriptional regulator [Rhodospirillaceae bacterium]MBT4427486.1 YebC/PmpR family DNA-binding transcriptional regulator [Rhodospirillaceae bacterium]MBT5039432.1 YebC/PmpR family DNA-binding transcriptional regulator [Rhodospirillaceae bacterium]MBT5675305.1 YebC/PmpR family DNA-binding transcriptional regulator [Rhodospirillaceae bacterium]MBT6829824.1 YebC/PmpR family DNA-binding transcriptional regulator [Rhodospirillaceae bacterium]